MKGKKEAEWDKTLREMVEAVEAGKRFERDTLPHLFKKHYEEIRPLVSKEMRELEKRHCSQIVIDMFTLMVTNDRKRFDWKTIDLNVFNEMIGYSRALLMYLKEDAFKDNIVEYVVSKLRELQRDNKLSNETRHLMVDTLDGLLSNLLSEISRDERKQKKDDKIVCWIKDISKLSANDKKIISLALDQKKDSNLKYKEDSIELETTIDAEWQDTTMSRIIKETKQMRMQCLESLSSREKAVALLRVLNCTQREIGVAMGISQAAINKIEKKNKVSKATKELMQVILQKKDEKEGDSKKQSDLTSLIVE